MGRIVEKLHPEKDTVTQFHTHARNITTNIKVKVYFTLPALSTTNVVIYKCHVDDSPKGRYFMILEKYILTKLRLNIKLFEHVIKSDDGTLKGYTTYMVDLGKYVFKDLNTEKMTPEELFTYDYAKKLYGS